MSALNTDTRAYVIGRSRQRRFLSPWTWLTAIALVLAVLFVALPIGRILVGSVAGGGLGGWAEFFTNRRYTSALGNSLLLSAIVTVIATALGVFLAYYSARFTFWGKAALSVLPLTAILVPEVIVTQSWLMMFGNNGAITRWIRDAFGLTLPSMYGWTGLVIILPLITYTYVYLGTLAALKSFDSQLEEAAMSLGTPPLATRMRVTIPAVLPAIAATSILAFTLTLGNFTTSTIIGRNVKLLAPLTYEVFLSETGGDPKMQSTLATVSILIVALILYLQRRTLGRRNYEMVQGRAWVPVRPAGVSGAVQSIIAALILVATLFPIIMVTVMAFTASSGPVLRWGEFSFESMRAILTREPQPILNTVVFGAIACVISVVFAVLVSVVTVRKTSALSPWLDYLVMLPLALSGTVLGIGMVMTFSGGWLPLTGTAAIIVLVFVVRRLPHGIRNASSTLHAIPESIEDASVSLGVAPMKSFFKVVIPLMVPGIAAAAVLTWTTIIAELGASLVVYSAGNETITIKVFQLMATGLNAQAASYGLILTLLAIVPIVIATRVFKIRLFD